MTKTDDDGNVNMNYLYCGFHDMKNIIETLHGDYDSRENGENIKTALNGMSKALDELYVSFELLEKYVPYSANTI
jgi:hypothetical protein